MRIWKVLLICGAIVAIASLCLLTAFPQSQPKKDLNADFDDIEMPRKKAPPKFKITVDTDADDLGKQVRSYINQELRGLGDVEIVRTGGDWELSIVAMSIEDETRSGRRIGYSFSSSVSRDLSHHYETLFDEAIKRRIECKESKCKNIIDAFLLVMASTYEHQGHFLSTGSDLQKMCKRVVTRFDIRSLEPERKKR